MALLVYILALCAVALYAPDTLWHPAAAEFILVIGVVGVWRYSWGGIHFLRALLYRHAVFPDWRRRADRLAVRFAEAETPTSDPEISPAPQLFVVVTSYRIPAETTVAVYRSLIEEAERWPGKVMIVASLVEPADERLLKLLFRRLRPADRVRLVLQRLPARGKRDALAAGLRAVARRMPRPDDVVVVMDGDTLLAPHTFARCVPFFDLFPRVGGLTTDEDALVQRAPVYAQWHALRFAQRHLLYSSLGLSRRLLAMTGRMSMFRASVAIHPEFIGIIQQDYIDHWRLGRIRFLTGEDKSTWLWLLERGFDMLYVPDVRVFTIEQPPARSFLVGSTQLMLRWFGNMLRGSGRAIELGQRRIGLFLWWCLIDQRLSMWTPLVGPLAAVMIALSVSPSFLWTYLLWVMLTRLLLVLGLLSVRPRVGGLWPLLLYYNQVYGALVKIFVLFRLDRQRWTRQNITLPAPHLADRWRRLSSTFAHGLALAGLATAVAFATGLLAWPQHLTLSIPS